MKLDMIMNIPTSIDSQPNLTIPNGSLREVGSDEYEVYSDGDWRPRLH